MARRAYREWELSAFQGQEPYYSIPPEWMVDETRQGEGVTVWENAAEYVETVKQAYRRDNWQDQARHVEVWSEKATILGAIRPVAREWGITLCVCHGFGSTGMESDIGDRFAAIKKDITVFYLGDHDPSGRAIEQDMHARVQKASGKLFRMIRLAIHESDIRRYNLSPQRIKASDSRAASFRREFGAHAATVELDALPAAELRRRIESAVTGLIDFEIWDRQVSAQEAELACIADFADRVKNLPQLNPESRI